MKHDKVTTCQIRKSSRFEGGKYIAIPCGRQTKGDKLGALDICRTCLAGIKRRGEKVRLNHEKR